MTSSTEKSSAIKLSPTEFSLATAGSLCAVFGFLFVSDHQESYMSNMDAVAPDNAPLASPQDWFTKTTKIESGRITENVLVKDRVNFLRYFGLFLLIVGWTLFMTAAIMKSAEKEGGSSSSGGGDTGMRITIVVITVIVVAILNVIIIHRADSPGAFNKMLYFLYFVALITFAVFLSMGTNKDGLLSVKRLVIAVVGALVLFFAQVLTTYNRRCCNAREPNETKADGLALKGQPHAFGFGVPLYCFGWLMLTMAVSFEDD